jgi:O-antigen ligase
MLYWEHYDVFGYEIDQITSIMSNPNPLGKLAFFGLLSSFIWFDQKRLWLSVASVCALGLILSGSRAAFLSTSGALFVYVIGTSRLSDRLNEIIILCIAFGGIGYLMLMRILPAPEFVQSINLSYRLSIWNAALDAGFAKPILGHGPENVAEAVRPYSNGYVGAGVYNSFIRLFVTTGIFGAISYIYIFWYSIVRYTPDIDHQTSVIIYSMFIGYAIDELFSGNSIFGISIMSVVSACLIGYIAYDSIEFYENR